MDISGPSGACSTHACDCQRAIATEDPDGVILIAERRHMRAKIGVPLEAADGLRLVGPDWPEQLEQILQSLSYSERTQLLVAPLDDSPSRVALPAETALLRAQSKWLPALLNGGELYPHVQPIVSLADGRTYGHEALIRGRVDGVELNGGQIFSAARAHGALFTLDLVGRIGALEQAMPKLSGDEILFINFTPTAIYDPAVCLRTTWVTARSLGIAMDRICFEVVETEEFPDLPFLKRILDEYRAHGAMVALDDLGAGHSSLSYLAALRPDVVKLDRELVSGIDEDRARGRLVQALVEYAHELDVRVVAEGIETEAELAAVRAIGADLGQGWYLGRPAADPVRVDPAIVVNAGAVARTREPQAGERSSSTSSARQASPA